MTLQAELAATSNRKTDAELRLCHALDALLELTCFQGALEAIGVWCETEAAHAADNNSDEDLWLARREVIVDAAERIQREDLN